MSQTIDQRDVKMNFDCEEFNSDILNTITHLNLLDGALAAMGKGGHAGIQTLINGFGTATTQISSKTVAMITTVEHYVNKVLNASDRLIKSLSIDNVDAGWDKYAEKTKSVQTIIAATGKSIDVVNAQLDKLNWFTDETSYSLTDMTNNIGKFVSNGVELDTAVKAMMGISTWASEAGGGVNEASRAMYNLSQAIGVGSVKLMDWRSIQNANMATEEFKNIALETAVSVGTLTKEADGLYKTLGKKGKSVSSKNFEEALKEEWFTSDVLIKTLEVYGGFAEKIHSFIDANDLQTSAFLGALEEYQNGNKDIEKLAKSLGLSAEKANSLKTIFDELSESEYAIGNKAFRAAQEAKTFSEAMDSAKEAVASGWMKTFELIFGNYEEAKVLWTDLSEFLYDLFAEPGNRRNSILEEAILGSEQETLKSQIEAIGISYEEFQEAAINAAKEAGISIDELIEKYGSFDDSLAEGWLNANIFGKSVEKLTKSQKALAVTAELVNKVIRGDYGNGQTRYGQLAEEGYNWCEVQNSVNEALGNTYRHNLELGGAMSSTSKYTEEQIAQLKALGVASDGATSALERASKEALKKSGRELIMSSIHNSMDTVNALVDAVSAGYREVIPELTSSQVYSFIEKLESRTSSMLSFIEDRSSGITTFVSNMTSSAVDLGSAAKSVLDSVGDGLNDVWKELGIDTESLVLTFSDVISKSSKWVKENNKLSGGIKDLSKKIVNLIKRTKELKDQYELCNIAVAVFNKLLSYASSFGKVSKTVFLQIGDALKTIYERIKPLLNVKVSNFLDGALTWLRDFGKEGDNVFDRFDNWLNESKAVEKGLLGFADAVEELYKKINSSDNAFSRFVSTLDFSGLSEKVDQLKNALSGFSGITGSMDVGDIPVKLASLKSGIDDITGSADPIATAVNKFSTTFSNFGSSAMTFSSGLSELFNFSPVKIWNKTKLLLSGNNADAEEWKDTLIEKVTGGLGNFGQSILDAGKGFAESMKGVSEFKINIASVTGEITDLADATEFAAPVVDKGTTIFDNFMKNMDLFSTNLWGFIENIRKNFGAYAAIGGLIVSISSITTVFKTAEKSLGVMVGYFKPLSAFGNTFLKTFGEFSTTFKGIGAALNNYLKTKQLKYYSMMLLSLAVAFGVLFGAIVAISKMLEEEGAPQRLWQAVGMISIVMFGLAAVVAALGKLPANGAGSVSLAPLLGLAGSLVLIVLAVSALSSIDIVSAVANMTLLGLMLWAMIAAVGSLSYMKPIDTSITWAFFSIALSMFLWIGVLAVASQIPYDTIIEGLKRVGTVFGALLGAVFLLGLVSKMSETLAADLRGIKKLVNSLVLLTALVWVVSKMDPSTLWKGVANIQAVMVLLAEVMGLALIMSLCQRLIDVKIGLTFGSQDDPMTKMTKLVRSLIGLIAAVVVLGLLPADVAKRGIDRVNSLLIALAACYAIMNNKWMKDVKGGEKDLLYLAAAVGILAISVIALSLIDADSLYRATEMVAVLAGCVALMLHSLPTSMPATALVAIALMGAIIAGIVISLIVFDDVDWNKLLVIAGAVGIVVIAIGASMQIMKDAFGEFKWSKMATMVTEMAALIGSTAAILWLVSKIFKGQEPEFVLSVAEAVGIVLLAVSASLAILSKFKVSEVKNWNGVCEGIIKVVGTITGVIAAIGLLIEGLVWLIEGLNTNAMGKTVDGFEVLGEQIDKITGIVTKIGNAIGSFFGAIAGGFTATTFESRIKTLNGSMEKVMAFTTDAETFRDKMKKLEFEDESKKIEEFVDMFNKLDEIKLTGEDADTFDQLPSKMTSIETVMNSWSEMAKKIDWTSVNKGAKLSTTIGSLTDTAKSIAGSTLGTEEFAEKASRFSGTAGALAQGMTDFSNKSRSINIEFVKKGVEAANALDGLNLSLNTGGLSILQNDGSSNLTALGGALKNFSVAIKGLADEAGGNFTADADAALTIANKIADLSPKIKPFEESDSGQISRISTWGSQAFKDFTAAITAMGQPLRDFAVAVDGIVKGKDGKGIAYDNTDNLNGVLTTLERIADFAIKLVDVKDVFKSYDMSGMNTMDNFLESIPNMAKSIGDFKKSLTAHFITADTDFTGLTNTVQILSDLASIEWSTSFWGSDDLTSFGVSLESFSTSFSLFYDRCLKVDTAKITPVITWLHVFNTEVAAVEEPMTKLTNLSGAINSLNVVCSYLEEDGSIAKCDLDLIKAARTNISELAYISRATKTIEGSPVTALVNDFAGIANASIAKMIEGFTEGDVKQEFEDAAAKDLSYYVTGMLNNLSVVKSGATAVTNAIISQASSNLAFATTLGQNFTIGLAQGMRSSNAMANLIAATNAITNQAIVAKTAVNLDEHSPSELARKFGGYWTEGLAQGVVKNIKMVESSTDTVTGTLINGFAGAVALACDTADAYQPTIRPVFDSNAMAEDYNKITSLFDAGTAHVAITTYADSETLSTLRSLNANVSKMTEALTNRRTAVTIDGETTIGWLDEQFGGLYE